MIGNELKIKHFCLRIFPTNKRIPLISTIKSLIYGALMHLLEITLKPAGVLSNTSITITNMAWIDLIKFRGTQLFGRYSYG